MRHFIAGLLTIGFTLGTTLVTERAFAQEFSSQGDFAVSAERLFGIHFSNLDREDPSPDFDASSVQLGWHGRGLTPFDTPRAAIDYFVIDHLSIGGALAFASYSGDADGSSFLLAPRVGYVWMMADWVGFWLRGGLTYHAESDPDEHGLALTGEAMFAFTPTEHVGFLVGATFDQDMFGETEVGPGPTDLDQQYRDITILQSGLMVWF